MLPLVCLGVLLACSAPGSRARVAPEAGGEAAENSANVAAKRSALNAGGAEAFVADPTRWSALRLVHADSATPGAPAPLSPEDAGRLLAWARACVPDSAQAMSPPPWPVAWEFSDGVGVSFVAFLVGPNRLRFNTVQPYSPRSHNPDTGERQSSECQGPEEDGQVWETLEKALGPTQVKEYRLDF